MMRVVDSSTALAPIFRSELQAAILDVLLRSTRPISTSEITSATGASQSAAHRELARLTSAGLLTESRVGRSALFAANERNPVVGPLRALLAVTHGPRALLAEALRDIAGISAAIIFGSFAARSAGQPGASPNDIDLLIVGTPKRRDVYDALDGIDGAVGREVNVTFLSDERWERGEDELVTRVQAGPTIDLLS